jgi:hypothetical protein
LSARSRSATCPANPHVAKSRTGFFANISSSEARSVGDGSFVAGATKTIALAC